MWRSLPVLGFQPEVSVKQGSISAPPSTEGLHEYITRLTARLPFPEYSQTLLISIVKMQRLISAFEGVMGTGPVAQQSLEEMLGGIPKDIAKYPLKTWDAGVFNNDLVHENLAPNPTVTPESQANQQHADPATTGAQIPGNITKGTYDGSQLAILEVFQRIESR